MSKPVLQILTEARELIADPKRWTTQSFARDAAGKSAGVWSETACRWCADGALMRSASVPLPATYWDAFRALSRAVADGSGFLSFNDSHTHPEVLALFDSAIAEQRSAQP